MRSMFKSWDDIRKHMEVVKFAAGLMDDSSDLMDCVCERFVEHAVNQLRKGGDWDNYNVEPLVNIAKETKQSIHPLCNQHLSYITKLPWAMKSKLYIFGEIEDWMTSIMEGKFTETRDETVTPQTCAIIINKPRLAGREVLEKISNLNQTITDLYIHGLGRR